MGQFESQLDEILDGPIEEGHIQNLVTRLRQGANYMQNNGGVQGVLNQAGRKISNVVRGNPQSQTPDPIEAFAQFIKALPPQVLESLRPTLNQVHQTLIQQTDQLQHQEQAQIQAQPQQQTTQTPSVAAAQAPTQPPQPATQTESLDIIGMINRRTKIL